MKKLLAILLVIIAAMSFSVSAFADDTETEPNTNTQTHTEYTTEDLSIAIDAEFVGTPKHELNGSTAEEIEAEAEAAGAPIGDYIYVTVEWDELKFVYDFGTVESYIWNIETLAYEPVLKYINTEENKPGWVDDTKTITFTNRSNRDVYTGLTIEKNTETDIYDDVEVTVDKNEALLLNAFGRTEETLDKEEFSVTVSGTPSIDKEEYETVPSIGSIKFYISNESKLG